MVSESFALFNKMYNKLFKSIELKTFSKKSGLIKLKRMKKNIYNKNTKRLLDNIRSDNGLRHTTKTFNIEKRMQVRIAPLSHSSLHIVLTF